VGASSGNAQLIAGNSSNLNRGSSFVQQQQQQQQQQLSSDQVGNGSGGFRRANSKSGGVGGGSGGENRKGLLVKGGSDKSSGSGASGRHDGGGSIGAYVAEPGSEPGLGVASGEGVTAISGGGVGGGGVKRSGSSQGGQKSVGGVSGEEGSGELEGHTRAYKSILKESGKATQPAGPGPAKQFRPINRGSIVQASNQAPSKSELLLLLGVCWYRASVGARQHVCDILRMQQSLTSLL